MSAPFAPVFVSPSTPGQLNNNHGSDQVNDAISMTIRYSNPKGSGQQSSLIRIQVNRIASNGIPTNPTLAWDSGYMGDVPACQNLLANKVACGGNCTAVLDGRLYFMPSDGAITSAPCSSGAIGTWRYETPLPTLFGVTPTVYSMTIIGSFLYCTAKLGAIVPAACLYMATINPDGTLTNWTIPSGGIISPLDANYKQSGVLGYWDGVSATGYLVSWNTTNNTGKPLTLTVNMTDGSISTAAAVAAGAPSVVRDNLAFAFIGPNNAGTGLMLAFIGGTITTASAVVDGATFTATTGAISTFVAKAGTIPVRSGGAGIILQNNTVYYIGGSNVNGSASGAQTQVFFNTTQKIDAGTAWSTSAITIPTGLWQLGGAVALNDYDLPAVSRTADAASEGIVTASAIAGHGIAVASFKPNGTPALVGVAGAMTVGTNGTVSPPFGQATVAAHLLVAYVSGSDKTPGGATNLGDTGGATSSWDFSGVNSDNVIMTSDTITVPGGGIFVNSISCYMGGYSASVAATFCVWNAGTGALICSSAITASKGLSLKTAGGLNTFIAAGTTLRIGFFRAKSGDAQWGVAGAGTFKFMTNQSSIPNVASASACGSPYVCGAPQFYLTYSTLAQADITTAAAGWVKAGQQNFDNEQIQIWYKPNCGTAETAPTFTSSAGATPLHAQLAEFSGVATTSALDQFGSTGYAGSATTSQTATAGGADGQAGDLIVSVGRWELSSSQTATFVESYNNVTAVAIGTTGGSARTRQTGAAYGIIAVGAASLGLFPYIVIVGGQNAAGGVTNSVDSAPVNPASSPSDVRAFITTNQGGNAQAVELGTGGLISGNQDGTQDITAAYGASGIGNGLSVGALTIPSFADGDQISITVTFVGTDGDPSVSSSTVIKIGEPPSISNISPSGSVNSAQPPVSFTYNPGPGGGAEAKYQITIIDHGGNPVFDSGIVAGQGNIANPILNPLLAINLNATVNITVYSSDIPMSGSTNVAQASSSFTPTQIAAASPTSASITVDNVGGAIIANWTNPLGSAVTWNRLYWRLSGTTQWNVAKDNIVPVINSAQNYTLMDTIPMGVAVDIAVSAIILNQPGTSETGLVTCGTGTISPDYHQDKGGFTAMLHIVGNGILYHVPLPNQPPIKFPHHIDSEVVLMFGNVAPSIRYGVASYREIEISVLELNLNIAVLDSLLALAQQGNVIVYRDTLGNVIYCGLTPDRDREIDLYFKDSLKLVEQQFTFTP